MDAGLPSDASSFPQLSLIGGGGQRCSYKLGKAEACYRTHGYIQFIYVAD